MTRWTGPALLLLLGCGFSGRSPPRNPDDTGNEADLISLGESHYRAGEYDSARATFTRALRVSRDREDGDTQAESLTWLGMVARQRADYPAARELLMAALQVQEARGATTHLWRINNVLGLLGWDEGRYYDALERHAAAARLAEAAGDSVSLAKSWNNVALVRTELGDFAEARRLLLASLPIARASRDSRSVGRVLVNLGMLAVRTGDPQAAFGFLEEARRPLAQAEDFDGELNRLGQLGTAFAAIGEPGRAIAYLDTALARARALGDPQEAASNLEHMASIYREAGDHARALRIFQQALALNDSLGLADEAAVDLRSIAEIHRELGNRDLARPPVVRALAIHRELGARLQVIHDLLLLARLDLESGDRVGAAGRHREAADLAALLDARSPRLAVAIATARMADYAGEHARVLRTLRPAAEDFDLGGLDIAWEAHWLSARAWTGTGALDSALVSARRAAAAVERVRGEFSSGMLRTRYQAAREGVYRDLVAILLRQGRNEEAFEAADAARGRVLLDHLATVRADTGSTIRELAEEERQLLRQMDTITVALDKLAHDGSGNHSWLRTEQRRLAEDLERIRGEYALALTRAEERDPRARALVGGASPSLGSVRAALNAGMALIEYFVFPDRLLAFVVTRQGLSVHESPIEAADLATRIRVVRELTGRPNPSAGLRAALEALHEALLGPALRSGALSGIHTLLLVPQGELEYVPFAALRQRETGRFLVQDFALLHLPSAAMLPILASRPVAPRGENVVFVPFPSELPGSRVEGHAFIEAFAGATGRVGGRATEATFRRSMAGARLVHLATHGVLNARNPLFSRLEFARGDGSGPEDDGRLEVHEVNRLRLNATMVFLSGCETGLGLAGATAFSRGEDYATLTRAFLNAGARNVIATLWRVEDRGAGRFASLFYRELAGQDFVSEPLPLAFALRKTQEAMIADPESAAPFFWAGFRLTGTGGPGANQTLAVRY